MWTGQKYECMYASKNVWRAVTWFSTTQNPSSIHTNGTDRSKVHSQCYYCISRQSSVGYMWWQLEFWYLSHIASAIFSLQATPAPQPSGILLSSSWALSSPLGPWLLSSGSGRSLGSWVRMKLWMTASAGINCACVLRSYSWAASRTLKRLLKSPKMRSIWFWSNACR